MTDVDSIITMFKWNAWANEKYRQVFKEMNLEKLREKDTPYGRKLLERIVHIFASFEMWKKRMDGSSPQSVISADDFDSWDDLFRTWREFEELLIDYVEELNGEDLEKEVTYTSFDGTIYTRKIKHILMHLTAHPNYHRGQLSAIFKEDKNLPDLPQTDMVVYFLEN